MLHLVKTFKRKVWDNILLRSIGLHLLEIVICLFLLGIYLPFVYEEFHFVIYSVAALITLRILINLVEELEWFKK